MDTKQHLLQQLHSPNAEVRAQATQELWQLWFAAAGAQAEQLLWQAERLVESQEYEQAEAILNALIRQYPNFSEAWNRRATLRYLRHQFKESLADCHEVVRLEPHHFGAWHGMGLCLLALHQYDRAAEAFRRALEIQPYARVNQELLITCLSKMN